MTGGLMAPLYLLWRHRRMIFQTTMNDIRGRLAASALGLAWLILYPLLLLGSYSVGLGMLGSAKFGDTKLAVDSILSVFCGLIPFISFASALGEGVPSVTSNASMIKNTLFPIDLIPVKAVFVGQYTVFGSVLILLLSLIAFNKVTAFLPLAVPIVILQLMFSIGVIWILSSIHVYFRDVQNIIQVVILVLMLVSPIWPFPAEYYAALPSFVRFCIRDLNPMHYFMTAYRDCLFYGRLPQAGLSAILAAMSIVFFFGGYWFFTRMKRIFADNV